MRAAEKAVLLLAVDVSVRSGEFYPSIKTMARETSHSARSIQGALKALRMARILLPLGKSMGGVVRYRINLGALAVEPALVRHHDGQGLVRQGDGQGDGALVGQPDAQGRADEVRHGDAGGRQGGGPPCAPEGQSALYATTTEERTEGIEEGLKGRTSPSGSSAMRPAGSAPLPKRSAGAPPPPRCANCNGDAVVGPWLKASCPRGLRVPLCMTCATEWKAQRTTQATKSTRGARNRDVDVRRAEVLRALQREGCGAGATDGKPSAAASARGSQSTAGSERGSE